VVEEDAEVNVVVSEGISVVVTAAIVVDSVVVVAVSEGDVEAQMGSLEEDAGGRMVASEEDAGVRMESLEEVVGETVEAALLTVNGELVVVDADADVEDVGVRNSFQHLVVKS